MKGKLLFVLIAAALLLSTAAVAVVPFSLDLSPYDQMYRGEVIDVQPGEIETLWVHLTAEPGLVYHVEGVSFHSIYSNHTGWAEVLYYEIKPTDQMVPSTWYPFGKIQVGGMPSTLITIQVDLKLTPGIGEIWSNTITKHITPEPSAFLALGTGLLGVGGLLLRRRR